MIRLTRENESFEKKLEQLERLVRRMEGGSLPLEETLENYRAGMKMAKELEETLSQAEKTMLEVTENGLKTMEDAP